MNNARIAHMEEQVALPRKHGELVFEALWEACGEARAFGLAVALNESGIYAWLETLEKLAVAKGLVTLEELETRIKGVPWDFMRPGTLGQGPHCHWFIAKGHAGPGGPSGLLAPSFRDSHLGFLQGYLGVRRHLGYLQQP